MKKLLLLLALFMISTGAFAQDYWTPNSNPSAITKDKGYDGPAASGETKLYELDQSTLRDELFTIVDGAAKHSVIITMPTAEGKMEKFEVVESSNFEPALQAWYPEIRSFAGTGITSPGSNLRISISPGGLQAVVFKPGKKLEIAEPYSADHKTYAVYETSAEPMLSSITCGLKDKVKTELAGTAALSGGFDSRVVNKFFEFRLALSVDYEYANSFNAKKKQDAGLVWNEINKVFTVVNKIFETDLGIRFIIIGESEGLMFFDKKSDPYWNAASGGVTKLIPALKEQLKKIDKSRYDLAHLLRCRPLDKSSDINNSLIIGYGESIGDDNKLGLAGFTSYELNLYIQEGAPPLRPDHVSFYYGLAHELGHQCNASHTHTYTMLNGRDLITGVEPGTGSTIMSYAGSAGKATKYNVLGERIPFFNMVSIDQIKKGLVPYAETDRAVDLVNIPPLAAVLSPDGSVNMFPKFIIPKNTPFALTGCALGSDNPNDRIYKKGFTYSWEQRNAFRETEVEINSKADPNKVRGPNFAALAPSTDSVRFFPRLETILKGEFVTGPLKGGSPGMNSEALSTVERSYTFNITLRDNVPFSRLPGGAVGPHVSTDWTTVDIAGNTDTFMVKSPNVGTEEWIAGTQQTVTWKVGGSDLAPVNCANVRVLLSIDGGYTWTYVLKESTPNTGSAVIDVPYVRTDEARIKVQSIGNIFFDICDKNFKIGLNCPPLTMRNAIHLEATASVERNESNTGNQMRVQLRAENDNTNPLNYGQLPFNQAVLDVEVQNENGIYGRIITGSADPYFIWVNAPGPANILRFKVRFRCISDDDFTDESSWTYLEYSSPVCGEVPVPLAASAVTGNSSTLEWTHPGYAEGYTVEYKKSGAETWTSVNAATHGEPGSGTFVIESFVNLSNLEGGMEYDWRVKAQCPGENNYSAYSAIQHFTTQSCDLTIQGLKYVSRYNTATLMWDAPQGAVSYDVEFKEQPLGSEAGWAGKSLVKNLTTPYYTIDNPWYRQWFKAGKFYYWRVRARCANGAYSNWSYASFEAPKCEVVPEPAAPTTVTGNSATLTWKKVEGVAGYGFQYRESTSSEWITMSTTISNNSVVLGSLKSGTNYQWRVKTVCGGDDFFSGYCAIQEFTTLGCDLIVKGLGAVTDYEGLSSTGLLSWTAVPGASSYEVEFDPSGYTVPPPTFPMLPGFGSPSYIQSSTVEWVRIGQGLTTTTCPIRKQEYPSRFNQWRVRARCANGGSGPWSYGSFGPQTCSAPAKESLEVMYISENKATFSWATVPGVTESYIILYRDVNFPGESWRSYEVPSGWTSATVSGLTPGTTYEWTVVSKCTSLSSGIPSDGLRFTTLCYMVSSPTGLTCAAIGPNAERASWNAVPGVSGYNVELKQQSASSWNTAGTLIAESFANLTGLSPSTWYDLRVKAVGCNGGDYTTTTFQTPSCFPPDGTTETVGSSSSVTLSWTAVTGAVSYTVRHKKSSATVWEPIRTTTTPSLVLTGLSVNTGYDWQVSTSCGGTNNVSPYTETRKFTTFCTIPAIMGVSTTGVTTTSATVNWTVAMGASNYTLEYKANGSSAWTVSLPIFSNTTILNNLNPGTTYSVRVRANCGSGGSSGYKQAADFTTICTAAAATGLASYFVSSTGATLFWNPVNGAASYKAEYKLRSAAVWTSSLPVVTTNFVKVTGLSAGSVYDWRVTTNCSAGSGSTSVIATFTTGCNLPAATGLNAAAVTATSATISWTAVTGAVSYTVVYKLRNAASWITQAAGTTATTVSLSGLTPGSLYDWQVKANCSGGGDAPGAESEFYTECNAPLVSGLGSDAGSLGAVVYWKAVSGAESYFVEYKKATSAVWRNLPAEGNEGDTVRTITDLEPGTLYDWRVSATCANGYSDYVSSSFTTGCGAPFLLNSMVESVTHNSGSASMFVYFEWMGLNSESYDLDIRIDGTPNWVNIASGINESHYLYSGIAAPVNTKIDWRVRSGCANGKSDYTEGTFTLSTVYKPCEDEKIKGLRVTDIGTSSAKLHWVPDPNADTHIVEYRLSASGVSGAWLRAGTAYSSFVLTGLQPGKQYSWHIYPSCALERTTPDTLAFTTRTSDCVTAFEPANNNSTGAVLLTSGESYGGAISASRQEPGGGFGGGTGGINNTGGDMDWYKITTSVNSSNTFKLTGPAGISYTLSFYTNPSGLPVASAEGSEGLISLVQEQPAGTYYIRVTGVPDPNADPDAEPPCYTITFNSRSTATCVAAAEPANNERSGAVELVPEVPATAAIDEENDVDWFRFTTETGSVVLNIKPPHGVGYKMTLYREWGEEIIEEAPFQVVDENIFTINGLIPGKYLIKMSMGDEQIVTESCYSILFSTLTSCGTAYEPNNKKESARALSSGEIASAAITTATDEDWFRITTTGNTNNSVELSGPGGVNYDLYVYNSAGAQIGSGTGSSATEKVVLNNQAPGTYYIKVMGAAGANSRMCYTVKATAFSCGTTPAIELADNTSTGAYVLQLSTPVSGAITSSTDVDWYKVSTTQTTNNTFKLTGPPVSRANYDLYVYNASNAQIGVGNSITSTIETVTLLNQPPGTYYAKVVGASGVHNPECYSLSVTATDPLAMPVAGKGVTAAAALTPVTVKPSAAIPSVSGPTGTKVSVYPNPFTNKLNLYIPDIKGRAAINVYDMYGKTVLQTSTVAVSSELDMSSLTAGIYIIRVMCNGNEAVLKVVKE